MFHEKRLRFLFVENKEYCGSSKKNACSFPVGVREKTSHIEAKGFLKRVCAMLLTRSCKNIVLQCGWD